MREWSNKSPKEGKKPKVKSINEKKNCIELIKSGILWTVAQKISNRYIRVWDFSEKIIKNMLKTFWKLKK